MFLFLTHLDFMQCRLDRRRKVVIPENVPHEYSILV